MFYAGSRLGALPNALGLSSFRTGVRVARPIRVGLSRDPGGCETKADCLFTPLSIRRIAQDLADLVSFRGDFSPISIN